MLEINKFAFGGDKITAGVILLTRVSFMAGKRLAADVKRGIDVVPTHVTNGERFIVTENWNGIGKIKLCALPIPDVGGRIEIDFMDLRNFEIGFAMTSHCVQAQTIHGIVVIHELHKLKYRRDLLCVAVSRADNPGNLFRTHMDKNKTKENPNPLFRKVEWKWKL